MPARCRCSCTHIATRTKPYTTAGRRAYTVTCYLRRCQRSRDRLSGFVVVHRASLTSDNTNAKSDTESDMFFERYRWNLLLRVLRLVAGVHVCLEQLEEAVHVRCHTVCDWKQVCVMDVSKKVRGSCLPSTGLVQKNQEMMHKGPQCAPPRVKVNRSHSRG